MGVAAFLELRAGMRAVDLGTGGGLPGLVLAIAYPEVRWTLMDATRKKADAVRGFARALGVENVDVVWGRAEERAHEAAYREQYDGVVARAVAPLPVLTELARGFVRPGGSLWAIKGPAWEQEVRAAAYACAVLGWGDVHSERVTSAMRPTWLVRMRAVGSLPDRYPRAAGTPQRQPLIAPSTQ